MPKSSDDGSEELVIIPNVVGMDVAAAKSRLEQDGLIIDAQSTGNVAIQSPIAGTKVSAGSTVAVVTVSGGDDDFDDAGVPNLVGMTVTQAYDTLKELGLKMRIENENRGSSVIASQNPIHGAEYQKGDTVTVVVSGNPPEPEDNE